MSCPELTFRPGEWAAAAEALKSLRRDRERGGGVVVLSAPDGAVADAGEIGAAAAALAALERLPGPVVLAAAGPLDAAGLALCSACPVAYLDPATELAAIDPAAALALGLAGRLTERLGPAGAARRLLGVGEAEPAFALGLARPAPDPLEEARATAARLADPAARLLHRSLAFAARSTRSQAAEFDRELLALLTGQSV